MKNKITACMAAIAALIAAPAFAADMPVKAPAPAPGPAPISWTGWYGGFNVGGTWSNAHTDLTTTNVQFCPVGTCGGALSAALASAKGTSGVLSGNNHGFIGGGQLGYNWQLTNWVAGFEADIQGVGDKITDSRDGTFPIVPGGPISVTTNLSVTKELDYFGTVRGRFGWLAYPSLLVYGTGGLAYGGVKSNLTINQTGNNFPGSFAPTWGANESISQTRVGWAAGGGFEWMWARRWSVKVEYLYYDLGSVTYNAFAADRCTIALCAFLFTNNVQTSTRFNGNIVRAGLNYHF